MSRDLKSALEIARAELAEAEKMIERVPALRDEVRGLELALARDKGATPADHSAPPRRASSNGWEYLTRPEAIMRVLEEKGQPLSPAEISEYLASVGRNDENKYVSAVLTQLFKRGEVTRLGYGKWTAPRSGNS